MILIKIIRGFIRAQLDNFNAVLDEKEKVKKIEIQYEELILKDKNLDEAIRELNEIKEKNDVLQLEKDKLTEKLAQL